MQQSNNGTAQHRTRVCIIGAGPSGMSALYHFAAMPAPPEIVCFEKQNAIGGLWNYTWLTGVYLIFTSIVQKQLNIIII